MDRRLLAAILTVGILLLMGQSTVAIIVAVAAAIVIISRKIDAMEGDYPPPESGLPQRKGKYITIKAEEKTPPS